MLASVVFIGAVLCAVGFMAWLAYFVLNRGFNTMLETRRESWRNSRNSLIFGALLLAGAVGLGYQFFRMEPPLPVPPIDPGMSLNSTPDAPGPSADKTLVAGAIVLSGIAFLFWLGTFLLNRSFNSSLRTTRESRQSGIGHLAFGAALLCAVVFFVVVFFQLDREVVVPVLPGDETPAEVVVVIPEVEPDTIPGAIQQQVGTIDRAEAAAAAAGAHAATTDSLVNGEE